ncbi:MAG: glycosyltransferase [Thalassobaculum sp.]|uniref:glycosyltransferase n=1 Tax=Thalassobaculum sp. TaxID=2022740 RepID=UPI0032EB07F1
MSLSNLSILWISPIFPFRTFAGNAQHAQYLLERLGRSAKRLDYIYYGSPATVPSWHDAKRYITTYEHVLREDKSNPAGDKWGIDDWLDDSILSVAKRRSRTKSYDVVVVDYVWLSKVFEVVESTSVKVLNTHDVFTDRDHIMLRQGLRPSWFYTTAAAEEFGLARADIVLAITSEERAYFELLLEGRQDVHVLELSHGITEDVLCEKKNGQQICIGYVASDNAVNKVSAATLFSILSDVNTRKYNVHFDIAGGVCAHIGNLGSCAAYKKGHVVDIRRFYENCNLIVSPAVQSTGMKIKSVEAIAYGLPLLTTASGSQGLPCRSIMHSFPSVEEMATWLKHWITERTFDEKWRSLEFMRHETFQIRKALERRQEVEIQQLASCLRRALHDKGRAPLSEPSKIRPVVDARLDNPGRPLLQHRPSNSPLVSVLVPAFNAEDHVRVCLDSLLRDALSNIEVIVVNDGSTDRTEEIVESVCERDPRVILVNQRNTGQGVARNHALDRATGEYVFFADADDYVENNALYRMYETASVRRLDLCTVDRAFLRDRPLKYVSALPAWCCFVHRRFLEKTGLRQPDIPSGQDGVFSNMLLTRVKSAGVAIGAEYVYNVRGDSTFHAVKKDPINLPRYVEQHLDTLRAYYEKNNLWVSQGHRYLLFLQDESFQLRLRPLLSANRRERDEVFLAIKSEALWISRKIGRLTIPYIVPEFADIMDLRMDQYLEKWGDLQ